MRLNLKEAAVRQAGGLEEFLAQGLPLWVELTAELMAARITSLVEDQAFFEHHFLATEGLIELGRLPGLPGLPAEPYLVELSQRFADRPGGVMARTQLAFARLRDGGDAIAAALLAGATPAATAPELAYVIAWTRFRLGDFPAAVAALTRAAWLEPAWPLHHWNLAAAAHRAGDPATCARALHAFLDHAGDPLAHTIDASHGHRVALARRFLVDHGALRRGRADDHGLAPST